MGSKRPLLSAFRISIDFVPQNSRGFENNYPSGSQLEVLSGLWVSSPPGGFLLDSKLAKTTDQEVFSSLQSLLQYFKKRFDDKPGMALAETNLMINVVNELFFRQGHLLSSSSNAFGKNAHSFQSIVRALCLMATNVSSIFCISKFFFESFLDNFRDQSTDVSPEACGLFDNG